MTTKITNNVGVVGDDSLFILSTTTFTNYVRKAGLTNEAGASIGATGEGIVVCP